MLEKPKRAKQLNNQDRQLPATIQELINRYDLENKDIYKFLDYLVDNINNKTATGEESVSGDTLPIGAIVEWNSEIIPENWLLCNGQAVNREEYSELFEILGVAYGKGDGSTTFNLPNYKGRVAVGKDESDNDFNTLGKKSGEKKHTLTTAEIPTHAHDFQDNGRVLYWDSGLTDMGSLSNGSNVQSTWNARTKETGGSEPHNNLQPYITTNFIIKAKQSSGLVATVIDSLKSNSPTDGLSANQGKVLSEKIEIRDNYITVTGADDGVYALEAWTPRNLELSVVESCNGDKLSLSNYGIKIGSGVNAIKVYGQVGSWNCASANFEFAIYKNNISTKTVYYSKESSSTPDSIAFPTLIIPVVEGDIINLKINTGTAGDYQLLTRRSVTYLTAEVLY